MSAIKKLGNGATWKFIVDRHDGGITMRVPHCMLKQLRPLQLMTLKEILPKRVINSIPAVYSPTADSCKSRNL